jgi:hypothetical protein
MSYVRSALTVVLLSVLIQSDPGQSDYRSQPPQDVSLFELRENGTVYNNCRVRVRGEYPLWQGSIGITDPKKGNILVSTLLEFKDDADIVKECRPFQATDFVRLAQSGELERTVDKITWLAPLPVNPVSADQLEAVHKLWKRKDHKTVEVVVVGRFDCTGNGGRLILRRDGTISWIGGFGQNWGDRIVVESIVIQKKTKRGFSKKGHVG